MPSLDLYLLSKTMVLTVLYNFIKNCTSFLLKLKKQKKKSNIIIILHSYFSVSFLPPLRAVIFTQSIQIHNNINKTLPNRVKQKFSKDKRVLRPKPPNQKLRNIYIFSLLNFNVF